MDRLKRALQEVPEVPLDLEVRLKVLLDLCHNPWLPVFLSQLEDQIQFKREAIEDPPTDLGDMIGREQLIGEVKGLRRLSEMINEQLSELESELDAKELEQNTKEEKDELE